MSFNATRLTCFAIISAIEVDLREHILSLESEHELTWGEQCVQSATTRLARERSGVAEPTHADLVDYLDFADAYQILLANKSVLDEVTLSNLKLVAGSLERLVSVRNRVAHSRPMEIDDLAVTHDVAKALVGDRWPQLSSTLERLKADPAFVLGLTVQLPGDPLDQSLHNLPIPDFDETGFFGRGRELQRIKKAILGPWPVVSILGDGGIGKTAIALKAAYDLLDDPSADFEAVVWVTAKATTLTAREVQNISGAIEDSLGMFAAAARALGQGLGSERDPVEEVLEYLAGFRILLILDNLETVTDQRLRDFLLDMPNGSKVLITSRIGLGMENPVKLEPLSTAESTSLLRALASIRNIDVLKSLDESTMSKLVSKLRGHPLYIKWLVAGVQAGRRPSELVNDNSLLLDYCMSNVYDKLSLKAREVLQSMQVMRGARGQGELAFLNDFSAQEIQSSLLELMTTNFISMRRSGDDSLDGSYETGEFASQYLARHQPITPKFRETVNGRARELTSLGQRMTSDRHADRFSPTSIDFRGQHDVPAARLLLDALRRLRAGKEDEALGLCHEAQTLSPTYHEAWRIEAVIQERRQDRYAARAAFERALELADGSAMVTYHFGVYLCVEANELEAGLAMLQAAARLEPDAPQIIQQIARAHFALERYLEALDSCRALAGVSQNPIWAGDNIELGLRSCVFGAESALWNGNGPRAVELFEACQELLKTMQIEQFASAMTDWLVRLDHLAQRVASASGDEYLTRRALEFGHQFKDKARIIDSSSLDRETGQVAKIDLKKHFGFIRFADRDYFFHHNDLLNRDEWSSASVNTLAAFKPDPANPRGRRALEVRLMV